MKKVVVMAAAAAAASALIALAPARRALRDERAASPEAARPNLILLVASGVRPPRGRALPSVDRLARGALAH